jgi:hypothetical protein
MVVATPFLCSATANPWSVWATGCRAVRPKRRGGAPGGPPGARVGGAQGMRAPAVGRLRGRGRSVAPLTGTAPATEDGTAPAARWGGNMSPRGVREAEGVPVGSQSSPPGAPFPATGISTHATDSASPRSSVGVRRRGGAPRGPPVQKWEVLRDCRTVARRPAPAAGRLRGRGRSVAPLTGTAPATEDGTAPAARWGGNMSPRGVREAEGVPAGSQSSPPGAPFPPPVSRRMP